MRPDEVTEVMRRELERYRTQIDTATVGAVIEVGDGIARVYGLDQVMASELVEFPRGVMGIALDLQEDNVGCILLGSDEHVREGDQVRCTGRILSTRVGLALFGRVVDPLGQPLDDKGPVESETLRLIDVKAPGVIDRQPVREPLHTGLKCIDSMTPIGRGQRELIIGDRQTGKTAIAIDTIINQRDTDVYCVYVAVGQKLSSVRRIAATLEEFGAMKYTCIVSASAADPAALQYIAPYAGCAIGEEMRDAGKHALVVYDDLSKHAQAYRQVALLLRRPPGREAYPGDIFNLHSRLLERAAKMSDAEGGGSLTALPIVETQEGDYSAYIPTNVISITDGQIYLEPDLFFQGQRPAMNVGASVSRVGSSAQTRMMRAVAKSLRLDLSGYREYAAFAQFAADLDADTRAILERGHRMMQVLKQDQYRPMAAVDQVIAVYAGTRGHLDDVAVEDIPSFEADLIAYVHEQHGDLVQEMVTSGDLTDANAQRLADIIKEFKEKRRGQAG